MTPCPSQCARMTKTISIHLYFVQSCWCHLPWSPWDLPAHLLPREGHLHVGVHQVLVLPNEGLLDIGHDAGVHPRQPLGTVDLDVEPSPLPLRGDPIREQEVPGMSMDRVGNSCWGGVVRGDQRLDGMISEIFSNLCDSIKDQREAAPFSEH